MVARKENSGTNAQPASERLQWGRAFGSAEGDAGTGRDRGRAMLQWGRAFGSAEGGCAQLWCGTADMLQWGRAFGSAEGSWLNFLPLFRGGFNGAALLVARKGPRRINLCPSVAKLQWGRAFGSAEGTESRPVHSRRAELQWGRAFGSAEGYPAGRSRGRGDRFNGAALLVARKVVDLVDGPPRLARASMGPRFW